MIQSLKSFWIVVLISLINVTACGRKHQAETKLSDLEIVTAWADMVLYVTCYTPANTPTYASRALGYIGVSMYESIVPGFTDYTSLSGQLNGIPSLPTIDSTKKYNWLLSLNAGQARILKSLYPHTSDENKTKIDSLEDALATLVGQEEKEQVIQSSVGFGRAVADSIFKWSTTDGGHRSYLNNFDKSLLLPSGVDNWRPSTFAQSISRFPLHPHWGQNRTFVKANGKLAVPVKNNYSADKNSPYYKQFLDVYEKSKILTEEEKAVALWWGDDPNETFTPPGHSYFLATLTIKKTKADLITAAETHARVGMAVADAFIDCWKIKYTYYSERPSSFVHANIDDMWEPFFADPPFPAFPSGHAMQAGALASVLKDLFTDITITDDSHNGRPKDELYQVGYKSRTYHSFEQIANEVAYSRFLGGIHTYEDNSVGLQQGNKVGENVNRLQWKKVKG
jgi:hypothetical protein